MDAALVHKVRKLMKKKAYKVLLFFLLGLFASVLTTFIMYKEYDLYIWISSLLFIPYVYVISTAFWLVEAFRKTKMKGIA